jgi:hypothetical protein
MAALQDALASSGATLAALGIPEASGRPRPALLPAAIAGQSPPPATAAELLGAGPDTLRARLGHPSLRRPEGTAEIWLYTAPSCALDLVLYPEGGGLRVAHAAARASGAEGRTEAECLRELRAGGQAGAPAAEGGAADHDA